MVDFRSHENKELTDHLYEVGGFIKREVEKTNFKDREILENIGYIIGISHDFGKYTTFFQDYLKKETGVRLKSVVVSDSMRISRYFEPSLPFGPWSNLIGDTLLVSSVEIHFDSTNTHIHIIAEFQIIAIETMVIPSGSYDNCIKVRRLLRAVNSSKQEIKDEESFCWFAPDVGLVRSETPQGSRELIRAIIGEVTHPHR